MRNLLKKKFTNKKIKTKEWLVENYFMGTPDFAVPVLQSLINSRHEVVAVVTQPDRPKAEEKYAVFTGKGVCTCT